MARAVLAAGAVVWASIGALGFALAAFGSGWLLGLLPGLIIDADALARAVGTFAGGLLVVAAAHVAVLVGLRAGTPTAFGLAILLTAVLGCGLLALAAAAVTSAVAQPQSAGAFMGAGLGALVAMTAYWMAAARLVAELRGG